MAKILLVDTSFSSAPIYRALLAGGHDVHVVGRNPSDYLAKQATQYWHLDYSDIHELSKLVESQRFDHIVPGCTDRSYESCVTAGQGRFPGLDSPSATVAIHNKGAFRRMAAKLGLPIPTIYPNAESAIGNALIIKPADAFSGKGVSVLPNATRSGIEDAIGTALAISPSKEVLIEEFAEGQLYSHSAFIVGRRVICDFLVQEDGTANRFVVDTSRVLNLCEHPLFLTQLRESIEALAEYLDLTDGLIHTQFIAKGTQIWIIETTRRCPGDLYSQLIELSTNYPYSKSYAMAFLGCAPASCKSESLNPILRHTISVPAKKHLDHIQFLREIEIIRLVPLSVAGDDLMPSPTSRVAVLFCRENTQESLDKLYEVALRRELYVVSDGN